MRELKNVIYYFLHFIVEKKVALGGSGGGVDISQLEEMFATKKEVKDCKDKIEDWEKVCEQMQKDIEDLKNNKLDHIVFDEEMEKLRLLLSQLNTGSGQPVQIPTGFSASEMAELREGARLAREHEAKI